MAIYTVRGPDGNLYDVKAPDGTPVADIESYMQSYLTPKPQAGFWDMFKESAGTIKDLPKAAVFGATDSEAARKELIAAQQPEFATTSLEDIETAGQAWDWMKQTAGASAGYLLAPALASKTASMLSKAPGAGKAVGYGAFALQYVVDNLSRQAFTQDEAVQKGLKPPPVDVTSALVAAGAQTWLDYEGLKFFSPLFSRFPLLRGLVGAEGGGKLAKEAEESLIEAFNKGNLTVKNGVVKGIAGGALFEIPQEIAQQALERWQAGLSLTDKDASREYLEAAAGAALLGGAMGGASGALDTPVQKQRAADILAARKAEEDAKRAAAQAEAAKQAYQQQEVAPRLGYTAPEKLLGLPAPDAATATEEPGVTPQPPGLKPTKRPSGVKGIIRPTYGEIGDEELDIARTALMRSRTARTNPNGIPYSIGAALRNAGIDASKDRINVIIHTLREEGFLRNQRPGGIDIGPVETEGAPVTPESFANALRSYGVEPTQPAPAPESAVTAQEERPFSFTFPPPSADLTPIPQQSVSFPVPEQYLQQGQVEPEPEMTEQGFDWEPRYSEDFQGEQAFDETPDQSMENDAEFQAGLRGEDTGSPWNIVGQQIAESLRVDQEAEGEAPEVSRAGWERLRGRLAQEGLLPEETPTAPAEEAGQNVSAPTQQVAAPAEPVQLSPEQKITDTNGFRATAALRRAAGDPRIQEIEGGGMDEGLVFLHAAPGYKFKDTNTSSVSVGNATDVKSALANLVSEAEAQEAASQAKKQRARTGAEKGRAGSRDEGAVRQRTAARGPAKEAVPSGVAAPSGRAKAPAKRTTAGSGSLVELRKTVQRDSISLLTGGHMSLANYEKLAAELRKARPNRKTISTIMDDARAKEAEDRAISYESVEEAKAAPKGKKPKKGANVKVTVVDSDYSRGARPEASQIRDYNAIVDAVKAAFNGHGSVLLRTGRLKVVRSPENLPPRPDGEPHFTDAKGYYDGTTTFIVSNNVAPSEVQGLILHEIGVHYGMPRMLGQEAFNRLKADFRARARAGDKAFAAAADMVPEDTDPSKVDEEGIAYLVQNSPSVPFVKRLLSALKLALYRLLGGRFISLNENDLRTLAIAALQRVSAAEASGNPESFYAMRWGGPMFYSALERMLDKAKFEKNSPDQWRAYIKSKKGEFRVLDDELNNSGVLAYLENVENAAKNAVPPQKPSVTKAELLSYMQNNGMVIMEYRWQPNPTADGYGTDPEMRRGWDSYMFNNSRTENYFAIVPTAANSAQAAYDAEKARLEGVKNALQGEINTNRNEIDEAFYRLSNAVTSDESSEVDPYTGVLFGATNTGKYIDDLRKFIPAPLLATIKREYEKLEATYANDRAKFERVIAAHLHDRGGTDRSDMLTDNEFGKSALGYYLFHADDSVTDLRSSIDWPAFTSNGELKPKKLSQFASRIEKASVAFLRIFFNKYDMTVDSQKQEAMQIMKDLRIRTNLMRGREIEASILLAANVPLPSTYTIETPRTHHLYDNVENSYGFLQKLAENYKLSKEAVNSAAGNTRAEKEAAAKLVAAKKYLDGFGIDRSTDRISDVLATIIEQTTRDTWKVQSPEVINELASKDVEPYLETLNYQSMSSVARAETRFWKNDFNATRGPNAIPAAYYFWDLSPDLLVKEMDYRYNDSEGRYERYVRYGQNEGYAAARTITILEHAKSEGLKRAINNVMHDAKDTSVQLRPIIDSVLQSIKNNEKYLSVDVDTLNQRLIPDFVQTVNSARTRLENLEVQFTTAEDAITALRARPSAIVTDKSPIETYTYQTHWGQLPNPMFHIRGAAMLSAPATQEGETALQSAYASNPRNSFGAENAAEGVIRTCAIDELQSDWAQDVGKKGEWGTEEAIRASRNMTKPEWDALDPADRDNYMKQAFDKNDPNYVGDTYSANIGNKPMPFADTKATLRMSIRRVINYAMENNYERIVFAPGMVHSGRWGSDGYTWSLTTDALGQKILRVKASDSLIRSSSSSSTYTSTAAEVNRIIGRMYAEADGLTSSDWNSMSPVEQRMLMDKYENEKNPAFADPKWKDHADRTKNKVSEELYSNIPQTSSGYEEKFVFEPSDLMTVAPKYGYRSDWDTLSDERKKELRDLFIEDQKSRLYRHIVNNTYGGSVLKGERAAARFMKELPGILSGTRTYGYRFTRLQGLSEVYDINNRSEFASELKRLGAKPEWFYVLEDGASTPMLVYGVNITPELREAVYRLKFPLYSRGAPGMYSRGPTKQTKTAPPHSDRTLEEIFRQRADTFEERFQKEGGIVGAVKYAFSYEGAERWIERLQNERRPLKRLQEILAETGKLIIGEKGFNNLYTLVTLSSGLANHYKTKYLQGAISELDGAMQDYAKALNIDIKTAMQRVDAYFLARHEPERRWIKYLLNVPLNNTEQFLVKETGQTLTAAGHRDFMLRELYSTKNLATNKEKTALMYKQILERFIAEKRYDANGVTTLRNVKPGSMSIDPDDAIYNVLGEFTQVELATLRDAYNAELRGANGAILQRISDSVKKVQDKTKTLNKMANYWSQPVDNIAAFYNWDFYIPYKGKPASRVSEGDDRLEFTSQKLMASDYTEFIPGFTGRDSPTDNSIFQVMADAGRSALRAGRKDVPQAVKNLGEQGHLHLNKVREIDFLERYTTDIDPDELKGGSNSRIFVYNSDGKIEIYEIKEQNIREALRRSWQDPSPFVQFANLATSAIGQSHTRYNPPFHPANFVRDVLTNAFTMGAEMSPAQAGAYIKEVSRMVADNGLAKAMKVARMYQQGKTDEIEAMIAKTNDPFYRDIYEYLESGGQVTYVQSLAAESKVESLVGNIQRGRFARAKEAVDGWVDVWADGFEFTNRAAGFAVMRNMLREREEKKFASSMKRPMTKGEREAMENRIRIEATSYVKNLANFEEVGRWGRGAGALFMFFRPAATGAVRALDALAPLWRSDEEIVRRLPKNLRDDPAAVKTALANHRKRKEAARKMLISVAGAGAMLFTMAMLAADKDEDGRNRILTDDMALWTRNLRLPLSVLGIDSLKEKYLQLPWGFGLGAFGAFGAQLMGTAYGAQGLKDMTINTLSIALDSYMPLPVSRINPSENFTAWLVDSITPSLGRPFLEFAMNVDSINREIYNNRVTKYGDAFLSGPNTPDLFIDAARWLTKVTNTNINWQPETLNFWTNSYIDGLAHIATTTYGLSLWAAGEKSFDVKTDLILMNSFFSPYANYDGRKFGKIENDMKSKEEKLKMVKRDPEMYRNYVEANPYDEMLVYIYNKGANNQLRDLREQRNKILTSDMTPAERKVALDQNRLDSNLVKRNLIDTFEYYGYKF